jgi:hypothetical protein
VRFCTYPAADVQQFVPAKPGSLGRGFKVLQIVDGQFRTRMGRKVVGWVLPLDDCPHWSGIPRRQDDPADRAGPSRVPVVNGADSGARSEKWSRLRARHICALSTSPTSRPLAPENVNPATLRHLF